MKISRIRIPSFALVLLFIYILPNGECYERNANITNSTFGDASSKRIQLEMQAMQKWKNAERIIHKTTVKAIRNFLVYATGEQQQVLDLSQRCMSDIGYVMKGLASMKFWAYQMLDSSGRLPSGILSGSVSELGDFDGCLSIDVPNRFKGRYCNLRLVPVKMAFEDENFPEIDLTKYIDLEVSGNDDKFLKRFLNLVHPFYAYFMFRMSICIPSSCNETDLEILVNKASEYMELHWESMVVNCNDKDDLNAPFNGYELTSVILLCFMTIVVLTGTLTEIYFIYCSDGKNYRENAGIVLKILLCFSFVTNTKRLMKEDTSPDTVNVFHGMKVFTILWVILNHTYNCLQPEFINRAFHAKEVLTSLSFQIVINGYPTVDTFFFISGAILVYGRMRSKDSAFSVPLYIFRRFWRLGPAIIFLTLGFFVVSRLGSGPLWKEHLGLQIETCYRNWWANLLFVNNFFKTEDMCMGWLWYVGADMQLYIAALIVLIPIKRRPKLGLWILGICTAMSIVAIIVNHIYWELPPTVVLTSFQRPHDAFRMTERIYYPFYTHAITYCMGMITGYIMYKKPDIRLPLWLNLTGWIVNIVMGLSVVYSVWKWNTEHGATMVESVMYAVGSKVGWSLCLAWVILMCFTGNGGFISKFLSWNFFVPFSRMTYSTYLVHTFILVWYYFSTKNTVDIHFRAMAFLYMGFVVASFMLSFMFTQMFEAPFMLLEKLMFSRRSRPAVVKQNGIKPDEDMMEKNNINHAFDYDEKGTYVQDTNKANLEYKSELNSSSL